MRNWIKPTIQILLVGVDASLVDGLRTALPVQTYTMIDASVDDDIPAVVRSAGIDILFVDRDRYGSGTIPMIDRVNTIAPYASILILAERPILVEAITAIKLHVTDIILKPTTVDTLLTAIKQYQIRHYMPINLPTADPFDTNGGVGQPASASLSGIVAVRTLKLNTRTGVALVGSDSVKLPPKEAAILAALMRQVGRVVSCRQLVATGWKKDVPDTEARKIIRPYVSRLRKKLQKDLQLGNVIVTVDHQGYVFSVRDVPKVV